MYRSKSAQTHRGCAAMTEGRALYEYDHLGGSAQYHHGANGCASARKGGAVSTCHRRSFVVSQLAPPAETLSAFSILSIIRGAAQILRLTLPRNSTLHA